MEVFRAPENVSLILDEVAMGPILDKLREVRESPRSVLAVPRGLMQVESYPTLTSTAPGIEEGTYFSREYGLEVVVSRNRIFSFDITSTTRHSRGLPTQTTKTSQYPFFRLSTNEWQLDPKYSVTYSGGSRPALPPWQEPFLFKAQEYLYIYSKLLKKI